MIIPVHNLSDWQLDRHQMGCLSDNFKFIWGIVMLVLIVGSASILDGYLDIPIKEKFKQVWIYF